MLGTEVQDEQLDPYLLTGRVFDFTKKLSAEVANALVPLLPRPMAPGMRLRRKFLMPSPTGRFGYQGEFDVWGDDSVIVPGLVGGRPLLGDIKTTSNLNYALTNETLATDVQAMLYAADVMFNEECTDVLDLVWWYSRTRGAHRVQRVHLPIAAPHVAEQFGKIDAVGSELAAIKEARPNVAELQPNARMCEAYGGCPYRPHCNLSPSVHAAAVNLEEVKRTMSQTPATNAFLAGLRKTIAPTAPPTVPALPSNVQAPPVPPPAAVEPPLPAWATAAVDPLTARRAAPAAINPPESALPPAPPVGAAAPSPAVEPAKRTRRTKAEMEAARVQQAAGGMGSTLQIQSEASPLNGPSMTEAINSAIEAGNDTFPRAELAAFLRAAAAWLDGVT